VLAKKVGPAVEVPPEMVAMFEVRLCSDHVYPIQVEVSGCWGECALLLHRYTPHIRGGARVVECCPLDEA